jgi:DNA-directed RNA polymerase subunit omega
VIAIARIDDLVDKVDSTFTLVHLAAKRAREINAYYAQLGEGLGQHVPPLVSTESNKPLSIALKEISQGKVEPRWPEPAAGVADPLAFIEGEGDQEYEELQVQAEYEVEGDEA